MSDDREFSSVDAATGLPFDLNEFLGVKLPPAPAAPAAQGRLLDDWTRNDGRHLHVYGAHCYIRATSVGDEKYMTTVYQALHDTALRVAASEHPGKALAVCGVTFGSRNLAPAVTDGNNNVIAPGAPETAHGFIRLKIEVL